MARPDLRIVGGTESKEGYENSFVLEASEIDEWLMWLREKMMKDGEVYAPRVFLQDVDWVIDVLCRNVCRMTEKQRKAFEDTI